MRLITIETSLGASTRGQNAVEVRFDDAMVTLHLINAPRAVGA